MAKYMHSPKLPTRPLGLGLYFNYHCFVFIWGYLLNDLKYVLVTNMNLKRIKIYNYIVIQLMHKSRSNCN